MARDFQIFRKNLRFQFVLYVFQNVLYVFQNVLMISGRLRTFLAGLKKFEVCQKSSKHSEIHTKQTVESQIFTKNLKIVKNLSFEREFLD